MLEGKDKGKVMLHSPSIMMSVRNCKSHKQCEMSWLGMLMQRNVLQQHCSM